MNKINLEEQNFVLPMNYCSKREALFYINEREVRPGEYKRIEEKICNQVPYITKTFKDIETNNYYYILSWKYDGVEHHEIIPASYLAIKRELVTLSNKSFGVTDNNARDLIKYFDLYREINKIPIEKLTKKIGRIKGSFIHPLKTNNIIIMPLNEGEKQLLDSFQCKNQTNDWIDKVFSLIQKHPKALLMVIASFASVLLSELKVEPFIVDLSGETSNGKTTLLKVCASVWGTSDLVSEWNITKVSLERKAAFLNSFPVILDDSRKAIENDLKNNIYLFSGGREKGRGSLFGSQKENTWSNILLSTGEVSLNDYTNNLGGAAARIISLNGLPFSEITGDFFSELHMAIDQNYGAIGLEFINQLEKKEEDLVNEFVPVVKFFQERALGNPVITRIARNYAVIFYTAKLLKNFFSLEIDLESLVKLFDQMVQENKELDMPKKQLLDILQELDANRKTIYYDSRPNETINAIYKNDTIWLTPSFIRAFFGNVEQKKIRENWLNRGYLIPRIENGKVKDYRQLNKNGENIQGIGIKKEILEDMDFDFSKSS